MKRDTTGKLSRRTALRTIGATGVAVGFGTGVGAARPDHAGRRGAEQRKREQNHEQNRPGHKDFECPDGMDHLGTFEFVIEEDDDGNVIDCYFEQTEGEEGLVEITGFDSKDGEECEPIVVYYESDSHEVGQISSFGGMDTHVDDPEDGVYESDLENRGGQQAAISLLHLCGTELEEDTDDDADDGDNGDSNNGDNGDDDTNGDSDDADDDESDVETA